MSTANKLNKLLETKQAIKQAIINKGVEVADDTKFADYASKISSIPMEGGDPYYEYFYNLRTNNGTSMKSLFAYSDALELDLRNLDVSKVTDMSRMFTYCSSAVNVDGWDTSKVINMNYMFFYFSGSIDISKFDLSSVTDAEYMFSNTNTDNIILTGLSFPSTASLANIFNEATGDTLDLSSWDISNIKNMSNLFTGKHKKIDLTGWNTSHVTSMYSMFSKYNNPLEELIIPDWDMTNITSSSNKNLFYNTSYIPNLKLIDLSRSNDLTITEIASQLPTRTATTFGTVVVPENTSQEAYDALVAKYWAPIGAAIGPVPTSCSIVAELDEIMPGKSTKVYFGAYEPWNADLSKVELVLLSDSSIATMTEDNEVISTGVLGDIVIEARLIDTQEAIGTKTILVTETDSYPNLVKFRAASAPSTSSTLITVNGSNKKLSNLTYDSITNIYSYDAGAPITSIKFADSSRINELVKLNVGNINDMYNMFYNCQLLTSLDVNNWDTSNVTRMSSMFHQCTSLTSLDLSSFNTSNVTYTSSMFYNCTSLTNLDLSNFDMTNTRGGDYSSNMFQNCNSLHTLRLDNCSNDTISKIINSKNFPITAIDGVTRTIYCKEENAAGLTPPTNWVFSYVTEEEPEVPVDPPAGDIPLYEYGQFTNNSDITEVSTMVTSEHTDLSNMFCSCSNLTTINGTDKWDTSNVNNMNTMFMGCNKLVALDASKWDTTSVTTMDNTFCGCHSLLSLDVSNWDVGNVAVMYGLFYNCRSLVSLNLSKWNTSLVENMGDMFYGCESLQSLDLSNWDASNSYNMNYMLYGCNSLQELHLDNCSYDTISKIINADGFPVNNQGNIYCKAANQPNTLPEGFNWTFSYVD